NERSLCVGGAKHDRVPGGSTDHRTANVALNGFHVRPRLHELQTQWRKSGAGAVAGKREHPGEAAFDKHTRFDLVSQEPAELDAPLVVIHLLQNLFRAGELLVSSHSVYS